jgi:hypothetical protein
MSFIESMKDKKVDETQGVVFHPDYEGENTKRIWDNCPSSTS